MNAYAQGMDVTVPISKQVWIHRQQVLSRAEARKQFYKPCSHEVDCIGFMFTPMAIER
jgi:hypothetical protein